MYAVVEMVDDNAIGVSIAKNKQKAIEHAITLATENDADASNSEIRTAIQNDMGYVCGSWSVEIVGHVGMIPD